MKNFCFFLLLLVSVTSAAQDGYWQQKVDVTMQANYVETDHTVDGFETIRYTNNSPDTLPFIWFHLWPNAYKNDKTAFSDQLLQQGSTRFYFSTPSERGYINRLDFKVDGSTAKTEDHPQHIDIVKLVLPRPLPPGATATITTPFHLKLPFLFSRSGYTPNSFQLAQWYPKPAVYDKAGWHEMPYLEQGEFYSEFGDYDVTITLPQPFIVAATGTPSTQAETAQTTSNEQSLAPLYKNKKTGQKQKGASNFLKSPYPLKTVHFTQSNVHDFALIARTDFVVDSDTCRLPSGQIVDIFTYYKKQLNGSWINSMAFAKDALRFYSAAVGPYPYNALHVAESAAALGGGMEYPMLTIISPQSNSKMLDQVIAHEVGHNWFYAALASNERAAPWLDEGLNTFYEKKYMLQKYGTETPLEEALLQTIVLQKRDQPIATEADHFTPLNYSLVAYAKAAHWMMQIEKKAGPQLFQKSMQAYYNQWKFKHPQETDFKNQLRQILPDTSFFNELYTANSLVVKPPSTFAIVSPLAPNTLKKYSTHPAKNNLLLSPAFGFNRYDKLMLGALFTNYALPPVPFRFFVAPFYATGSKKWNGISHLHYTKYKATGIYKMEAALTSMAFSKRYLPDSLGKPQYERFLNIVPTVRITLSHPDHNAVEKQIEAKTYGITETVFSKFVTASNGALYVDSLARAFRYVNQLSFTATNYRTLYPYSYQLQVQQGAAFFRINLTGSYFLNYAKGGGASVRIFAAGFGYLTTNTSKRFATTRYQPKLLGVSGEEDFTYSSYFLGRTASYANDASVVDNGGLAAQQIMVRDGGFKLRIDPFEFLQGRSEHWVAAINITSSIPRQVLPPQIPLKLFLDIGSFAEAHKIGAATNGLLYVAGLQLSLFKNVVNIYAPLFYSSDFRNNLKSLPEQNTFLKRLTFSIDFGQLSLQKLTRNQLAL